MLNGSYHNILKVGLLELRSSMRSSVPLLYVEAEQQGSLFLCEGLSWLPEALWPLLSDRVLLGQEKGSFWRDIRGSPDFQNLIVPLFEVTIPTQAYL